MGECLIPLLCGIGGRKPTSERHELQHQLQLRIPQFEMTAYPIHFLLYQVR